mgnify:CR=1 FL=1
MTEHLTVVSHPLVQHKLTLMRDENTPTAVFRQLLREISQLLAYEVTRELPMTTRAIETPMCEMEAPALAGKVKLLYGQARTLCHLYNHITHDTFNAGRFQCRC